MNAEVASPPSDQPTDHGVHRLLREAEDYARREPAKAVAAAFGAGLLLNLLPTRMIVGTITAVAAPLVRPAILALGLIKACELCSHEGRSEAPSHGAN